MSTEEETQNNSNVFKIVAIALAAVVVILGFLYFSLKTDSNKVKVALNQEKEAIISELEEYKSNYEEIIEENNIVNDKLIDAEEKIGLYIDSLSNVNLDVENLLKYRNTSWRLANELKELKKENEILKQEKELLKNILDSTNTELTEIKFLSDSLLTKYKEKEGILENATYLGVSNLEANGVIARSSGKMIPTERSRRTDKLKVCFSVARNILVEDGEKTLYVQVISPTKLTLGENGEFVYEDEVVNYSLISTFNYESKNLNVCEYLESEEDFEEGIYKIKIYNKSKLLATSELKLK
jgi:hypothetical protein